METFVVRVWTPAGEEPIAGLRGTVTHLRSAAEISFSNPEALLDFLGEASNTPSKALIPETLSSEQEHSDGPRTTHHNKGHTGAPGRP